MKKRKQSVIKQPRPVPEIRSRAALLQDLSSDESVLSIGLAGFWLSRFPHRRKGWIRADRMAEMSIEEIGRELLEEKAS